MKKKRLKILLFILFFEIAGVITYGYYHPEQHLEHRTSGDVSFPVIAYRPYRFIGFSNTLRDKQERFFDGVTDFVRENVKKYGDSLKLSYELERGKGDTKVIFHGTAVDENGKPVVIDKVLEFDITIRKDVK